MTIAFAFARDPRENGAIDVERSTGFKPETDL